MALYHKTTKKASSLALSLVDNLRSILHLLPFTPRVSNALVVGGRSYSRLREVVGFRHIMQQKSASARGRGFTIVELLIVIVVIGILAAISIVAYNGIQNNARMAQMQADFRNIKQAVEIYRTENGAYPTCVASMSACNFTEITPQLRVANLPTKTRSGLADILYVAYALDHRWGVRLYDDKNKRFCKVGDNMLESWWSSAPTCW